MNFMLSIGSLDISADIRKFFAAAGDAFLNFNIFSDLVDILLLTVIFFFAVKFFKNRQAGALILGICICLLIFAIAFILDFTGISLIISSVFEIGLLALVVIFQPEIRELLEKVGSGSLKGLRSIGDKESKKKLAYKTVDEIVRAVQILSVEKTGALIVIERTTKLDEIVSTGTRLDAEISDPLLRNLFVNRAPLHDGAVVISEGKVVAAACILPLPRRTILSGDLGTRHRAGVGLSETSDAVTVIVSEETGIISVAKESDLIRNFTADSLRKFLVREIVHEIQTDDEG